MKLAGRCKKITAQLKQNTAATVTEILICAMHWSVIINEDGRMKYLTKLKILISVMKGGLTLVALTSCETCVFNIVNIKGHI